MCLQKHRVTEAGHATAAGIEGVCAGLRVWATILGGGGRRLWFRNSRAEKGPEEVAVVLVLGRTLMASPSYFSSCGLEGPEALMDIRRLYPFPLHSVYLPHMPCLLLPVAGPSLYVRTSCLIQSECWRTGDTVCLQ